MVCVPKYPTLVAIAYVLLLLLALMGPVEASATELVHVYGGTVVDQAFCVIEHSIDHGFVLAGKTNSVGAGSDDFMLVKTNSLGVVMWTKTFGGINDDKGRCVIEHSIGNGLVVAGQTKSFGAGNWDIMLVKTDSVGVEVWTKTYGGANLEEEAWVIEYSADQGFVISGQTASFGAGSYDFMLVKTDSDGVEEWTRTYGGPAAEYLHFVMECNGGFVLVGSANKNSGGFGAGLYDMMIIKTSFSGYQQWAKTFGTTMNEDAYSVIEHSLDNGLALVGRTASGSFNIPMMLLKTNSMGVKQWTKQFGRAASQHNIAYSVIEHSIDQGFVIAGETTASGAGSRDFMLIKTTSLGVKQWAKTYGGTGSDIAYCVIEHSIGNRLVIAGQTASFGAGGDDFMLVVEPSDGSGTNAGANATPPESAETLTEATPTTTQAFQTLTEDDITTLVDADQTITTTVTVANPSQSPSQSASVSLSGTSAASASASPSGTSAASASASSTSAASASPSGTSAASASASASLSGTSAASQTSSQTASQTNSVTPSASTSTYTSPNVDDPCDDNLCASGAGCVVVGSANQYTCDCTAISTADVRAVGRYCNTTVEGKPVSVGDGNCPGCESAFVCTDSYSGGDPDAFMKGVIPILAAAACGCANPPQALLDQFGAVQYQVQDDTSLCIEFTIYSGNPNITAADIVQELEDTPPDTFTVHTNRLTDFDPCDDEVDGCNSEGSGGDDSLLFIIIGVGAFCFLLLLGVVWYCIHKRVDRQYTLQNRVAAEERDVVTVQVGPRASTALKE